MTWVCLQSRHARLPLPNPPLSLGTSRATRLHLISSPVCFISRRWTFRLLFLPAFRRRRHGSCRGTCTSLLHHRYGSDSRSVPAWPVRLSWQPFISHLVYTSILLMIRVTTRVYPRQTAWSSPHYHCPSCTLLFISAGFTAGTRHGYGLLYCFSCMAFRLEDTILALIRPLPCTIRHFYSLLAGFLFRYFPAFRAIIIPSVTDCHGRQTDQPCCCSLTAAPPESKHAPMARQLPGCSSSLHCCVVSSFVSCCVRLDSFPCCRAGSKL
jgi:hypothetical protein